ncbi:MAG: hypothetical protein J1F14_07720 [Treponema sp.]|nr:hypothetical protein [Treponema sp.]
MRLTDKEQSIQHTILKPSVWNAISEFETVELPKDSEVSFTFQQPAQGTLNHNSWALAIYEKEDYKTGLGQFVRADTWLNISTDAKFTGGIWSAGGTGADMDYENGYTAETAGKTLPTNKDVVVTVSFDGTNVTITETVDGEKAMSVSSTKWN